MYIADQGSIPDILYGPSILPGVIIDHRGWALMCVAPQKPTKQNKVTKKKVGISSELILAITNMGIFTCIYIFFNEDIVLYLKLYVLTYKNKIIFYISLKYVI